MSSTFKTRSSSLRNFTPDFATAFSEISSSKYSVRSSIMSKGAFTSSISSLLLAKPLSDSVSLRTSRLILSALCASSKMRILPPNSRFTLFLMNSLKTYWYGPTTIVDFSAIFLAREYGQILWILPYLRSFFIDSTGGSPLGRVFNSHLYGHLCVSLISLHAS